MTRTRALLPHPTAQLALPPAAPGRAGLRAPGTAHSQRHFWAQAALVWLLLALVVVPTLGRLHQVLHANALPGAPTAQATVFALQAAQGLAPQLGDALSSLPTAPGEAATAQPVHAHNHATDDHAHSLLDLLLAHHAPVDCLLLDQLALGDALHCAPTALVALVLAQTPVAQRPASAAARHVAFFHARGPPAAG
ncbi:MAG: hypothetical protein Q8N13_20930 [Acidovorax sp.]|nr:hypothetical protein [Acidovorax sp.]